MTKTRPVFAAFDQGQIPQIAVFNQATTPLGVDLDALVAALQKFVTDCVAPVWGTPARLARTIKARRARSRTSSFRAFKGYRPRNASSSFWANRPGSTAG